MMTIVKLWDELGIAADDLAVIVAALGEPVGDEST